MNQPTILIAFILNLPWTLLGAALALLSMPRKIRLSKSPLAIVVNVQSFWWYSWMPRKRRVRAVTNGQLIQLGPLELPGDLAHELIHVEQAIRTPFLHGFLTMYQTARHGYEGNKYEREAYESAGNPYKPKPE